MELLNQPFNGQLGNRLIELLDSPDYQVLTIVVAFAKNSGVLRIMGALEKFRNRGGTVNVYVGVDLGGTSYEALMALRLCVDSLNVVHSEGGQTFHAKIYQFLGGGKSLMVVGSHNLTGGGLWTNFESSVLICEDGQGASQGRVSKQMSDYVGNLASLKDSIMLIGSQEDIDKLHQHGYVCKEVAAHLQRAKVTAENEKKVRLFGNGVPASQPSIAAPKKALAVHVPILAVPAEPVAAPSDGEQETIWFETRRMTGGSRNILDLSMKSLVERGDPAGTSFDLGDPSFMRGGVEFFGLNPAEINQKKDITINFEGVDYRGNKILFPVGGAANGTWRLQIKGVDSSGEKITDAFRKKGRVDYLVDKVLTFTRVAGDYYFMSVFPESELEDFKLASRILARNGSTTSAKQLGLL